MKWLIEHRWTILVLRLALGGILLYAGITKISNTQAFADSIATFQILPASLINLLAMALPPFEILVGAMLVLGYELRVAAFASVFLTIVFAFALGQALLRGLEVDCGCFGSGKPSPWKTWISLGRDLLMLAAALLIYRRQWHWRQEPTLRPSEIPG
jgi:hypothetical protein